MTRRLAFGAMTVAAIVAAVVLNVWVLRLVAIGVLVAMPLELLVPRRRQG